MAPVSNTRKAEDEKCVYLFSDREPYQAMFDSSRLVIERMLIQKFGADFYKKHLRIGEPSWNTDKPYAYGTTMMHPFTKPSKISFDVKMTFNDSMETDLGSVYFDSLLQPLSYYRGSLYELVESPKSAVIKTTNFQTLPRLFGKSGYHFGSLYWDYEKMTFISNYWSKHYPKINGKDTLWESKSLTYDLYTKKYVIEKYSDYPVEAIACGYHSPFKAEFKDTFSLAPGWRTETLPEAIISIPPGWNFYTYEYSYNTKITYITNGEDTLIYQLYYGILVDWDNRMTNDPLYQELEKRFPEGTRFGREVDFYLRQVGANCYFLSLITIEEGVGMNFNEISNSFKFERLCPGHISLALDILNSIRFFRY